MEPVTKFVYDFVEGTFYVCTRCNYAWKSRSDIVVPRCCPSCKSRTWKNHCRHVCRKCGYEWTNSRDTVAKCPQCQSRDWFGEGAPSETGLSERERLIVLELFNRDYGAVKISRETNLPFGNVYDFLLREIPEDRLRLRPTYLYW